MNQNTIQNKSNLYEVFGAGKKNNYLRKEI